MSKQYEVFITCGVYVEVDDNFDLALDGDNFTLTKKAVEKMFSYGEQAVIIGCDMEAEPVDWNPEEVVNIMTDKFAMEIANG